MSRSESNSRSFVDCLACSHMIQAVSGTISIPDLPATNSPLSHPPDELKVAISAGFKVVASSNRTGGLVYFRQASVEKAALEFAEHHRRATNFGVLASDSTGSCTVYPLWVLTLGSGSKLTFIEVLAINNYKITFLTNIQLLTFINISNCEESL